MTTPSSSWADVGLRPLLRRIADGDREALGALYDRCAPVLYAVAHRIGGDDTTAETVVEHVFAEVWRDRRAPGGSALGGIVSLVARCRALALARRNGGTPMASVAADFGADSAVAEQVLDLGDDDRASAVGRAMLGLSPSEQRVVDRAYFAGESLEAIAEDMGAERDEVRRQLRTALGTLRSEITPSEADA